MKIREAVSTDVEGITYVHVESWKSTYRGLISEEYLDNITLDNRRRIWKEYFESPNKEGVLYVAEDETGNIVGFANGGACRELDQTYDAELYAIYLLKEHQGNGIGKSLIRSVVQNLIEKEYKSLMAWVLKGNSAIDFYHKVGGESISSIEVKIGNELFEEVEIGWSDLRVIL